ncbi:MAG: PAS domain-containing sensor histidine kinase, partial [Planctomycetaceae bacterium]|nr:PAS domain-containing sensor histidine kinase [Planctomycetaceae bacterium]
MQDLVLKSMTEGVCVIDEGGMICYTNPAMEVMFGFGPGELIGRHVSILNSYPPEESARIAAEIIRRLQSEGAYFGELSNRKKDGTPFTTYVRIKAIEHEGKTYGVSVREDITEDKRAEKAQRRLQRERDELLARLQLQFERMPIACVIADPQFRIIDWNPAAEKIFGYRRGEVLGMDAYLLVAPASRAYVQGIHRRLVSGDMTANAVNENVTKDGRTILCEWFNTPLRNVDGEVIAIMAMGQDVTERKRAEEALRQSELRFARFMQNLPGLAWIKDLQGRYVYVNGAAEKAYGTPRAELYGKTDYEVFPPETAAQLKEHDRQALASGTGLQVIETLEHEDGVLHHSLVSKFPIFGQDGEPALVGGIAIDVTECERAKEALRESEKRFRALADATPVLIWGSDADMRCTYFNKQWLDFTGRTAEQDAGQGWTEGVHPDDLGRCWETYASAFDARRPFTMEYRLRRHDGEYRWILDTGVPRFAPDGTFSGYIGSAIDITDRKRAEEELREADRRKEEFLAVLSHEIRNPLAPIQTALDLMKRAAMTGAEFERERGVMERQVDHLSRLVDDLLDVSRISRGRIELHKEVVDLAAAVAGAIEAVRPRMVERRQVLQVSLPKESINLAADPTRLEQILLNLLTNAAKYTDVGGQIMLSAERHEDEVEVRVRDTGIGIAPEMLPRIFDLFVQGERRLDRALGGLGIGLSLVKSLVEMHGGSVTARSEGADMGSEFVVRLP